MSEKEILNRLRDCVVNLDIPCVEQACKDAIVSKVSPLKAITEGMVEGMKIVGDKYEEKEYFLSELIMSAEVMNAGVKILEPHLKKTELSTKGKVAIGTVRGDLHDLGKNLVVTLLKLNGFDVIDLGIDVPAEDFIKAVRQHKPRILALSSLLTTTMPEMGTVIDELKKNKLRNSVKVIIGGGHVTQEFGKKIGADASTISAVEGIKICEQWASARS